MLVPAVKTVQPAAVVGAVLGECYVERRAVGHRHPALALDGQRARARRGGGRAPRVAGAVVLDEERRGEDVARARRIDLVGRPRPYLVALAVDEEERAVAVGGEGAEQIGRASCRERG